MSGCSYTSTCPNCGSEEMGCYSDTKPYDTVNGECLNCGFCYHTEQGQMELWEVNDVRQDHDLPPLEKLAQSTTV